jgi:hypothetical protein
MPQPVALLLTIAIETPLAFALVRRLGWGAGWRAAAAAAVGVAATHFFAWAAILQLETATPYLAAVGFVETGVVLVKIGVYRALVPLRWRRALVLARIVNSVATATGLLYYAVAL